MSRELSSHPAAVYKREYRKKNPGKDRRSSEDQKEANRKYKEKCLARDPVAFRRRNTEIQLRRYHEKTARGECAKCKNPADAGVHCKFHRDESRRMARISTVEVKIEILTHYGKNGMLLCNWPDCEVIDPDMLSLDHINNDGHIERKNSWSGSGRALYMKLRAKGYPEGFQTLCHNHQWKKELMRLREAKTVSGFKDAPANRL